jgi:hypothetical protein
MLRTCFTVRQRMYSVCPVTPNEPEREYQKSDTLYEDSRQEAALDRHLNSTKGLSETVLSDNPHSVPLRDKSDLIYP